MTYAVFDSDNNLIGTFARPQPHLGESKIIPDAPNQEYTWNGEQWVFDRSSIIAQIKSKAQELIINLVGGGEYWREKQMNLQSRYLELLNKQFINEILTEEEINEKNYITEIWEKIKAIRQFSNSLESDDSITNISSISWPV